MEVNVENVSKGSVIPKLAAKFFIRDLEEQQSFMHDDFGHVKVGMTNEDVIKEIVRISTRFVDYVILFMNLQ